MGYGFSRRDASVAAGIRRIAAQQVAVALAAFADDPAGGPDTIHAARKACKKLRAILRIVRPVFPDFRAENAAIREIAAGLAGRRDADVLAATFDGIASDAPDISQRSMSRLRDAVSAGSHPAAIGPIDDEHRDVLFARLQDLSSRSAKWSFSAKGFSIVAGGVEDTARAARTAMRHAARDPDPEALHEWRKHVKYHWYQTRLLSPIWPHEMAAQAETAGRLGELLGQHHDLAIFVAVLKAHCSGDLEDAVEALTARASARQRMIEAEAFWLGRRLHAESPEALLRRWRRYWRLWRREDADFS